MLEDEPFLRAILANPADRVSRLVYADWLDERSDPRGEYARLAARVAELPHGHPERHAPRRRLLDLQPRFPSWWVAIVGGLRAVAVGGLKFETQIAEVSRTLGRGPEGVDEEGFAVTMDAAVTTGLTGAVAYVELRQKWDERGTHDHYCLSLRDAAGRIVKTALYTHSTYTGCRVRFFEWYGDAVLFIYREKHRTYAVYFGFDGPAKSLELADNWILEGREVAYLRREDPNVVRRMSVPDLAELPPLTPSEAGAREMLPKLEWL